MSPVFYNLSLAFSHDEEWFFMFSSKDGSSEEDTNPHLSAKNRHNFLVSLKAMQFIWATLTLDYE